MVVVDNQSGDGSVGKIATSRHVDPEGEPKAMAFRHFTALSELISNLRLGVMDRLFRRP